MINNQKFVSAEVIAYELGITFKSKTWDISNIRTWCSIVETRYIKDAETMVLFQEIDLVVDNNMLLLPCNIFRVLDIYDEGNRNLDFQNNGAYAYDFKYNGVSQDFEDGIKLYINYRGTNVDTDTGEILIVKGHEEACKTFCKIQAFEEDAALGKFSNVKYGEWKEEFSGQKLAARYNVQHKSRKKINDIMIIRGNEIPRIGSLMLYHELYK